MAKKDVKSTVKKAVAKTVKKVATKAAAVKKAAVKKVAPKKEAKPRVKRDQSQSKFMQPMKISDELAAVVGKGPMPRTEVTKQLWVYIKAHKCQDAKNKRNINPDDKLAKLFGSKKTVSMFEMTKLVNKHIS
jgi:upstream activation factor subunit UAF30